MTQPSSCTSGLGVTDLATGYAERPVLSGIDLDIAPGKTTAIVGANACGKSTLLRTLSRLLTPARGEVLLDGKSIHRLPAASWHSDWACCLNHRSRRKASRCSTSSVEGATPIKSCSSAGVMRTIAPCWKPSTPRIPPHWRSAGG